MHVLMIGLDSRLVHGGDGSARQRHVQYAAQIDRLTAIAYSGRGFGSPTTHTDHFTAIPTNSFSKPSFLLDAYRLASQIIQQHPVDLITTQDPFSTGLVGLLLRNRYRIPLLVQNHSYFFGNRAWMDEHPIRNRALHAIGGYVVRHADAYRTVNQQERETYLQRGGQPERVFTIPVAVASERFAEPVAPERLAALRAKLGLAADNKVIIWVGYPVKFKRVPVLLQAFQQVLKEDPKARLMLVGDMSASLDDLDAISQQLGIDHAVLTPGLIVHDDLPAYYQLASLYAHTSSYEGLPRVLSEAASAGLPIVGMDCVGVRDIIEDSETGYLVPDLAFDTMAQRILALLHAPSIAAKMGAAGQQQVLTRYHVDTNAAAIVDSWRRAVALGLRA